MQLKTISIQDTKQKYLFYLLKTTNMKADTFKVKKPRTDKRRNIGKVAEELIENPNKTEREIAKETWLWRWTVNRAKQELEQTGAKDPTIAYIVGKSKERIKTAQAIFDRYLQESSNKENLERWDIVLVKDIVKDDLARVTVLWWTITDEEWWLKDLTNASIKEIEERIKHLLW